MSLETAALLLDLVIVAVLVGYAAGGYRQGLLVSLASLVGFVGGAVGAALLLPELLSDWDPGLPRAAVLVGGTVIAAVLLQALFGALAGALRDEVTWEPARVLDAATGLVGGVLVAALLVWLIAGAIRVGPFPVLARVVASSRAVTALDSLAPPGSAAAFRSLYTSVSGDLFPRVFVGGEPEPVRPVAEPDAAVLAAPEVAAAAAGIVQVTGVAEQCNRGQAGSGFVVAPGRVVTNAHVVAGMSRPRVQVGGEGARFEGRVVVFDPDTDLAVIDVPELDAGPLPLGEELGRGDPVVVAGFPLDGPYATTSGRVRDVLQASGADIYGGEGAVREVYSLRATVQPGNSGGPLLDESGQVVGVVFARSLDDAATGYALTLDEAAPVLAAAGTASSPVDTLSCAPG